MNQKVTALIAVRSKELGDALQALLESTTQIHAVYQTHDAQSSTDLLKRHHPTLMLCDYALFQEIGVLANTHVLVFVDNLDEQSQVVAKGVSNIVITGTPVEHLVTMISDLLSSEGQ